MIELDLELGEELFIELLSVEGKRIKYFNTTESKNNLNVSDLEKGIYICKITGVNRENVFKIVKQ